MKKVYEKILYILSFEKMLYIWTFNRHPLGAKAKDICICSSFKELVYIC